MNKSITLIIIILLFSSFATVKADDETNKYGNLTLLAGYVTMYTEYASNSWFDMKLSNIPDGFVITNGNYLAWCIQQNIFMTKKVNHTVKLFSSYDSNLPESYKSESWDKINYILNHKTGNRSSIQDAIWYYIENKPYPTDLDAQKMIDEAELYGDGFIPEPGQIIAIIVEGVHFIQRTFLELTFPESVHLGDLVWHDLNENGILDKGEPGISGVEVQLYNKSGSIVNSTKTDKMGFYWFNNIPSANYYLKFILPDGYYFTKQDQGPYDWLDSDANVETGDTILFKINYGIDDISWDAGIVKENKDHPNQVDSNYRPTADATAGEPYFAVEKQEIEFNGSRSYDRDGYIVNWSWDFGDETEGFGETTSHIYEIPGTYKIVLKVTDNDGLFDIYETEANIKFENRAPENIKINGPTFGHKNIFYSYSTVCNDPDGEKVQYCICWGKEGIYETVSNYFPSGTPYISANSWAEPGKYIIKVNASDSKLFSFEELVVYIDRVDVGEIGYLIDENSDGIFDLFFYSATGKSSKINTIDRKSYLLDIDNDGSWDYEFNTENGKLAGYSTISNDYPFFLIIFAIITIFFIIIIVFLKKKHLIFN